MAESNTAGKIVLNIKENTPEDLQPKISKIKDKADFLNRQNDKGLVNENGSQASLAVRDGKVNVAASEYTGTKTDGNSNQLLRTSFEEKIVTNKWSLATDEININGHKLNPRLWEYTDFKIYEDQLKQKHMVGNFCVSGTVLVKAWDHQLKRYMLIRRPTRLPMFANLMNVPDINANLEIADPSKFVGDYPAKENTQSASEWYKQVLEAKQKKEADAKKNAEIQKDTTTNSAVDTITPINQAIPTITQATDSLEKFDPSTKR